MGEMKDNINVLLSSNGFNEEYSCNDSIDLLRLLETEVPPSKIGKVLPILNYKPLPQRSEILAWVSQQNSTGGQNSCLLSLRKRNDNVFVHFSSVQVSNEEIPLVTRNLSLKIGSVKKMHSMYSVRLH